MLVTGSARLDFYRFGGDSLQGRHQLLRLHPLSVGSPAASIVLQHREGAAFRAALHRRSQPPGADACAAMDVVGPGGPEDGHGLAVTRDDDRPAGLGLRDSRREARFEVLN